MFYLVTLKFDIFKKKNFNLRGGGEVESTCIVLYEACSLEITSSNPGQTSQVLLPRFQIFVFSEPVLYCRPCPRKICNIADLRKFPRKICNIADLRKFPRKICNIADLRKFPRKICNIADLRKFPRKICNIADLPPRGEVCNIADLPPSIVADLPTLL